MVKILIGNANSKIVGHLPENVHEELHLILSYFAPGAPFSKKFQDGKWDGRIRFYHKHKGQSFYTGLLSLVTQILTKHEVPFKVMDRRQVPEKNLPFLEFNTPVGFEQRDYQDFTISRAIQRTRGILKVATGGGKCLGKGTPILMYDGSTKNVEDVVAGELLMGPDSTPRVVKSTTVGNGELFEVSQINGDNFICNDEHILCLQRTGSPSKGWSKGEEVQITAKEYFESNKTFKHTHKGYKVGVDFKEQETPIDPYFLGLWLGDGHSHTPAITTGDKEISEYLYEFATTMDLKISTAKGRGCDSYYFVKNYIGEKRGEGNRDNCLLTGLRDLNLIRNKHIPDCYKINSRENRLKVLAGLIDSDGFATKTGAISICSVREDLANDICWLARSLGFRSSINKKRTTLKSRNYVGEAFRVRISGKISDIPIRLKRRQAGDKTKYADIRYGIKVEPIGIGNYYGFEIDGDRKFLLGDFTVTHNTYMVAQLIGELQTAPFMFYVLTKDLLDQAYDTLSSTLNVPIGRIGAGHFDIKDINVCTIQTAIRAIKDDKSFKISDYMFDAEDEWDDSDLVTYEKATVIRRLLGSVKGLYLDESHHASSQMCRDIMGASPNAYWRFGGTATPYREDNAEIVLQGLFGKKIVDISASYLIDRGYLLTPNILFDPIHHENVPQAYQSTYSHCITKNDLFHAHVAKTANHLVNRDLTTLILVQRYAHGNALKKLIPDTPFVTGKMSTKNRAQAIQDLRDKKIRCMIATTLADEGLDIPTLDAALLAGGGASATRVYQRVGRTLRPDRSSTNPRDKSIVVVYDHKARHLTKQTTKIRKLLKVEKSFKLHKSSGNDYILGEIDEIMGTGQQNSIFDI
jgi:superfamily II DNA or RNA helicase